MTAKRICVNAMGTALFVVLSLCLQVPILENYYLCIGYVVVMVFCYCFGPAEGMVVGSLGVVLYCLLINGLRGMPGWAVGNLVIGLAVGMACRSAKTWKNAWIRHGFLAGVILLSTAVAILGVKSLIEVLLYAQPMMLRIASNSSAFVADALVLLVSLPICPVIEKIAMKI